MNAIRLCVAMTLGVIASAVFLVALGVPGAFVLALAPVAICLSMILLMAREGDVDAGLRRYQASLDASGKVTDNTLGEYPNNHARIAR
jgi:hypothetical protein